MKDKDGMLGAYPSGTTRDGYQLLIQTFELRLELLWDYNLFMALRLCPAMMERGYHLLVAGTQLTGRPGRVVHVWRRDAAAAAKPERPGAASLLDELSRYVARQQVTVLTPTAYDADRWLAGVSSPPTPSNAPTTAAASGAGASARGSRVYLMDTIKVRPGKMSAFVAGKRDVMVPLIAVGGSAPWTLLASGWVHGVGAPEAINVWEMPESDALLRTMRRVSENIAYQTFVRECVHEEDQNLLSPIDFYEPRPVRVDRGRDPIVVYRT